jgi:pyruvate kinase
MRRAKIVATIGPASRSPERLRALMLAGMNVLRANMSHGSQEEHAETISSARSIAKELQLPLAILLDLSGPKVRTGLLRNHSQVQLTAGQQLTITTREVPGDASIVSTSYGDLPKDVHRGNRILLADGLIELRVEECTATDIICSVVNGGALGEHKGINVPDITLSTPSLTEKDRRDLSFGLAQGIDYVALSFVRSAADCERARQLMGASASEIGLIAKIEKREALNDLDRIIEVCDGVMVARGDLGVEMAVESVPFYQKQIIEKANTAEKLVITATQMLESMTHEPRPTRAEASDVANAILDGTDAVMLSAETATGEYPVEAVETMSRIVTFTESSFSADRPSLVGHQTGTEGRAIAEAASYAAQELGARFIIVFSRSGTMARHVAARRPAQRVIAFTPLERTRSSLAAVWGIEPYLIDFSGRTVEFTMRADNALVELGLVEPGERVIVMAGEIPEQPSISSMMRLHRMGSINRSS